MNNPYSKFLLFMAINAMNPSNEVKIRNPIIPDPNNTSRY
jgi:hypothetical protein